MRRTEVLQGLREMNFEEVLGRTKRRQVSQEEAASMLGMSERTFRRWRDRFEAEGAAGLYDRRLNKVSSRRAPMDEVMRMLELFDTRYWDFTAKHFHEKLVEEHGLARSYNWVRLSLQSHGRKRPAPRRGAHRRKRPRRALPGMMLLRARLDPPMGSRPMVGPDRHHGRRDQQDLLGLLRRPRGDHEQLPGTWHEVIEVRGLFCSLYVDRAGRSMLTGPATTGTRPKPAARWTRTTRPRSAERSPSSASR